MNNRKNSNILTVRIYTNKSWSHGAHVARSLNVICSSSTISNILLNLCMSYVKWISDKATQAAHAFNIRLMKSEWNPVPLNSHTFHIYWSHLVVLEQFGGGVRGLTKSWARHLSTQIIKLNIFLPTEAVLLCLASRHSEPYKQKHGIITQTLSMPHHRGKILTFLFW